MFGITRGRLVAAAFGLSAAVASAQAPLLHGPFSGCAFGNCAAANHGTYGPALFAANPPARKHLGVPGPDEPACVGRSSYPLSDWAYIRQFCGPTLQPGTCYGHHQTKWRKWEEACPGGQCGTAGPEVISAVPAPLMVAPPPAVAPTTPPTELLPTPKEDKPKADAPKTDVPKLDPITPPKVPLVPKESGTLPVPALPAVPLPMPAEPGKINMTEGLVPMPPGPAVVPPTIEPRVVVPPERK